MVQNNPATGTLGFENEIYLKIFLSRSTGLRCLKFGMYHYLLVSYQIYSNGGPRAQVCPRQGSLVEP